MLFATFMANTPIERLETSICNYNITTAEKALEAGADVDQLVGEKNLPFWMHVLVKYDVNPRHDPQPRLIGRNAIWEIVLPRSKNLLGTFGEVQHNKSGIKRDIFCFAALSLENLGAASLLILTVLKQTKGQFVSDPSKDLLWNVQREKFVGLHDMIRLRLNTPEGFQTQIEKEAASLLKFSGDNFWTNELVFSSEHASMLYPNIPTYPTGQSTITEQRPSAG